jgi:ferredoxin-NADP reductase/predicted pyridoxine 5'-phosphate oxidase superfamily flavin-nucleotide-binding protein
MAHKYAQIAFTEQVRQVQIEQNSRAGYARMDQGPDYNFLLSDNEATFIQDRDSFYMASVSETDWPYVQHRGGPTGFLRVIDASTLGFADFKGNRQYVSMGNFRTNDRVALFLMDYPNRRRLKIMGRIEQLANDNWELLASLEVDGYRASVERAFIIHVEAFDWNCPQHITPRFTEQEVEQVIAPIIAQNKILKSQLEGTEQQFVAKQTQWSGDGALPLVVSGIRQLTPRVRAYELRDPEGQVLPKVTAGAHLQLPVTLQNGEQVLRHYSICSNPRRRDIYEVAVLKEPEGKGGSLSIHHNFELGQLLNCAVPENYFSLHDSKVPAVLIAGGIGITPIKAMAQTLKCKGLEFSLHYAGRSLAEMAFQDRLQREFSKELFLYSAQRQQRMDIAAIMQQAPVDAVFYVCGPAPLIESVIATAEQLDIAPERIRYERFTKVELKQAKAVTLELLSSNKIIHVAAEQSLLDAMLAEGLELPFSCKTGECKSCVVTVLEGQPLHLDNCLTEDERNKQKKFCPCVSRSHSTNLSLDI